MQRRSRALAGLIALMALTFSLAESVWASTCAPVMAVPAAATADPAAEPDCGHGGGGTEGEREPAPHCPLGPAATAQGCLAAASLPSAGIDVPMSRSAAATGHFSDPAHLGQVSGRTPFHPPRAAS